MCGIAGATQADEGSLRVFLERLGHRGPDGRGFWRDDALGLVHTRLAVIDLSSGGQQPMHSDDGRWVISYNGEIYNYRELRSELEAEGERFRSSSDTEVLMTLLMRRGVSGLSGVVGMFAIALWDRERRELLLIRDRLGVKPLVYALLQSGGIAFASEIRALCAYPGIDLGLDREALSEYLACLYVPAPRTIYRGIRKLPPGHVLRWRDGITTVESYWTPAIKGSRVISVDAAVEELLPVLHRAVAQSTISDVPVGCFLSGGIDSSVVAALMASAGKGQAPRTFTLTFEEAAYDERDAARVVATAIRSQHTELLARPGPVAGAIDAIADAFGEPFGNPTALLIKQLSQLARQHVTVALVGDGGDEVFAGYPRYAGGLLARRYRRAPGWSRGLLRGAAELIPDSTRGWHTPRRLREFLSAAELPDAEMYAAWVEYFAPDERKDLLSLPVSPDRPIARVYRSSPSDHVLDAMQYTDMQSFLPGNVLAYGDAMSMAHALEVRVPLLDHRVVGLVDSIHPDVRFSRGKKTLLRAVAERLLPREITRRPKRGLNPPLGGWLRGELRGLVAERLNPTSLERLGIAWQPVARLLAEHGQGRRDHALKIWSLLMAATWDERRAR